MASTPTFLVFSHMVTTLASLPASMQMMLVPRVFIIFTQLPRLSTLRHLLQLDHPALHMANRKMYQNGLPTVTSCPASWATATSTQRTSTRTRRALRRLWMTFPLSSTPNNHIPSLDLWVSQHGFLGSLSTPSRALLLLLLARLLYRQLPPDEIPHIACTAPWT